MQDNYQSFDNLETTFGKSSVTQERVSLVASHMYKQYLDFNNAANNGYRAFLEIDKELQIISDLLKQSFAARNISTQNIYVEKDSQTQMTVVMLNVLWHKISFSIRSNLQPKALPREIGAPMLSYRIMAIKGNYNEIMKNADKTKDETETLLENEVASLFIPAEKTHPAIMTIRHLANKELPLSAVDASKEFVLKVLESVCGGGIYHEMSINLGNL
ncbi:hypothetical protein IJ732_00300 [bacterium]|nr:hypothetical protein [bacterium]